MVTICQSPVCHCDCCVCAHPLIKISICRCLHIHCDCCVCVHTRVRINICTHVHIHIHTYMHIFALLIYKYIRTHIRTYTHTHTHTHTHIHAYIRTYTYGLHLHIFGTGDTLTAMQLFWEARSEGIFPFSTYISRQHDGSVLVDLHGMSALTSIVAVEFALTFHQVNSQNFSKVCIHSDFIQSM